MARAAQPAERRELAPPPGFKTFALTEPAGMRYALEPRPGIDDQKLYWLENYLIMGKSSLRSLWDVGEPVYTAPTGKTIIYFAAFNLGSTDYFAIFLDDGSAVQIPKAGGSAVTIGPAGTFWSNGLNRPGTAQWGNQYLLIVSRQTKNSYWLWDGTLLYGAGTLSPVVDIKNGGIGYTSSPTITFFGGHGSGASAVATVTNGSVTEVTFTNPGSGYENGDAVGIAFSGGGNDTQARAHAVLAGNQVGSIVIDNPGTGYPDTPTVQIRANGGGGNDGAAIVSGISADGKITEIYITNIGHGYTNGVAQAVIHGGGGNGCQLTVIVAGNGEINSIIVNSGGTGFNPLPDILITGGNGTGATAAGQVSGGVITNITVTNGGSSYDSVPTVIISGSNTAAHAIVDLMPFGVSGDSIETFESRVWIENDDKFYFSAPGSTGNFATSAGGGAARSTEPFLKKRFAAVKQANGFLYLFGDSSIQVISNVQTSGSPATTTFNNANTDPQVGNAWRDSTQAFGRALLFANPTGIYGLFGGTAEKLSEDMDGIFQEAVLPTSGTFQPSGAVTTIYKRRCYLLLITIADPFTGHTRPAMVLWDGQRFAICSQSKALTFIGTQETDSTPIAYGTDGTSLYQLLAQPSIFTNKIIQTKLWAGDGFIINKQALRLYWQIRDNTADEDGFQVFASIDNGRAFEYPGNAGPGNTVLISSDGTFQWVNNQSGIFGWENDVPGEFFWRGRSALINGTDYEYYGLLLGITTRSASPDHTITSLAIGYRNYHLLGF